MKPLVIDLYCGLGGWSRAFLDEGYDAVGFDVERHVYGEKRYPGQLVLQDVLTLHGSQFRNAAVIVASPPCQKYSYMAQPWDRAKREGRWQKWERDSPFGDFHLNDLFDACFRLQREASDAAGRYVPLIVENVKGAQPWVGRAAWHYGSFYLYGDVPALMPYTRQGAKVPGITWSGSDKPGYVARGFSVTAAQRVNGAVKTVGHVNARDGYDHTRHLTNQNESDAIKQHGSGDAWWDKALDARRREATAIKNGGDWFGSGENMSLQRRANSQSTARKAASALVAEIPYDLAQWIARCFKPANDTARFPATFAEEIARVQAERTKGA